MHACSRIGACVPGGLVASGPGGRSGLASGRLVSGKGGVLRGLEDLISGRLAKF